MDNDYVLLAEKEEMWAKMLMEVLEDNGIRCASLPVKGIGLSMRVGVQDCLRVLLVSLCEELHRFAHAMGSANQSFARRVFAHMNQ